MQVFKFINNRLPTKARDHKHYRFRPQFCSQCQGEIENEDHIIRCYSATRQEIRKEWLEEIETYLLRDHTPISVKHAIYNKMQQWLEPSESSVHEIQYDQNFCKAINEQKKNRLATFYPR